MLNRIVLLIIINAAVALIFKSFSSVSSIFTLVNQVKLLIQLLKRTQNGLSVLYKQGARTCRLNIVCSLIETLGNLFFLINLSIFFLFFYKFDLRFNECSRNILEKLKKYFSKNKTT